MPAIVDTRLLGRPPKFGGDAPSWKTWQFQTIAYFGAVDHATQSDLVTSGALDVQISTGDMSDNAKARSRMV